MDKNITKTALITGASSSIGKETVLNLAVAGYNVYGAARNINQIPTGTNIQPVYIDHTDSDSIEEAIGTIISKVAHIDILVNVAGYGFYGTIESGIIAKPWWKKAYQILKVFRFRL